MRTIPAGWSTAREASRGCSSPARTRPAPRLFDGVEYPERDVLSDFVGAPDVNPERSAARPHRSCPRVARRQPTLFPPAGRRPKAVRTEPDRCRGERPPGSTSSVTPSSRPGPAEPLRWSVGSGPTECRWLRWTPGGDQTGSGEPPAPQDRADPSSVRVSADLVRGCRRWIGETTPLCTRIGGRRTPRPDGDRNASESRPVVHPLRWRDGHRLCPVGLSDGLSVSTPWTANTPRHRRGRSETT